MSDTNHSLADSLDRLTVDGTLVTDLDGRKLRCVACGHRCLINEGRRGICKVRYNESGRLRVPHGYVAGLQCDPTEKKPFFHVMPGSDTLTFGMLGCDLHCAYCQNWVTSQALRDPAAVSPIREISADAIVEGAIAQKAAMVASSYNEPLITAEWAFDVFTAAKSRGLLTGFVSNGNATPEVLEYLRPVTDCYKVDLKTMSDREYRTLGGVLQNVLDTIQMVHDRGFWLEIVTLLVPGWNTEDDVLRAAADFIASVSPSIPWHVTAFHRDYRMTGTRDASVDDLLRAGDIGREAGLHYVYAGNLPGRVGDLENTTCPRCGTVVIERTGFRVKGNHIEVDDGTCGGCGYSLPGIWSYR